MPVMVVGVDNIIAEKAVRLLVPRGGEVRVFVPAPDPQGVGGSPWAAPAPDPEVFRSLGCKVAHGFLDDEAHVETALEQVHTVLLLLGRPVDDPETYLDKVATVVSAAIGAGCRRLVMLSDLAVTDPAGNPWLEALAEAEAMVADAPLEGIILRCALVYGDGDPLTTALASGALGDSPIGTHWPVSAGDVAMTAVLADSERDIDSDLQVIVDLTGPMGMSTGAMVRELVEHIGITNTVSAAPGLPDHTVKLLTSTVERPAEALGAAGATIQDVLSG